MSDTLIYLISLGGPAYAAMTDLCIRSLRTWGRYDADIQVLTDGSWRPGALRAEVVRVPPLHDPQEIKLSKAILSRYVDHGRYRRILYMDTDMLAVADVTPLFDIADDAVSGMIEEPFTTMLNPSCGGDILHPGETDEAGRSWGINAGLLCMSAELFPEVMRLWLGSVQEPPNAKNYWADQPFLNRMVLRGHVRFEPYPRYWVEMPAMYEWFGGDFHLRREQRILHFAGDRVFFRVYQMRRVSAALDAAWDKDRLRKLIVDLVHMPHSSNPLAQLQHRVISALERRRLRLVPSSEGGG
jgi:hypothetical protein